MIDVRSIVFPFFEFVSPYKPGQPLYLVPERAAVLCLASVIIARDLDTGEEKPVWGTAEYERLRAGEDLLCGPVLVVELSFSTELEDLLDLVTAVRCNSEDAEDDDDANDLDDDEDDDVDDLDAEDEEEDEEDEQDDEDLDEDFDDDFDAVGDDDEDDEDEDEDEDEEDDEDDGVGPI
ncbi:MAG TPA: hypothetical protein VGI40_23095 [Pirellulaceae bacterium]|jgi:hypothetical protein